MSENPESPVLRAIAELEAEDRAEPWFVKYERDAASRTPEQQKVHIPDLTSYLHGLDYRYRLGWTEGAPVLPYVEMFADDPPAEPYTIDAVRRALDRITDLARTMRRFGL